MEKSRLEIKVGLFVAIGLALLGVLVVWFNRGANPWRGKYVLRLHTANVGGLKPTSGVLLAGVGVGKVSDIELDPSGTNVTITLEIYQKYPIYHDARFAIESANVLGDQFVSVIAGRNQPPTLTNGEDVECDPPFNLLEAARGAAGVVQLLEGTATKLEASVTDLRAQVLNAETLANFGSVITNLRVASQDVLETAHDVRGLVSVNGGQVSLAVSNFVFFSAQLDQLAQSATNLLATNGVNLDAATRNIQDLTANAQKLVKDMETGHGLAGELIQNNSTSTNVALLAQNLAIVSSNLNRFGLWHILWSHPEPDGNHNPNGVQQPPRSRP